MPKKQEVLCDYENGILYRRVLSLNTYKRVGSKNKDGYLIFGLNGKTVMVHRYLYERYHNVKLRPNQEINHINHVKTDNRIINLEVVSRQQNNQWVKKQKDNTSGHKGVGWQKHTKKWRARICVNGKLQHIGLFDNIELAKQAYNAKATELNNQGHKYYIPE